jgi:hypothetical protein
MPHSSRPQLAIKFASFLCMAMALIDFNVLISSKCSKNLIRCVLWIFLEVVRVREIESRMEQNSNKTFVPNLITKRLYNKFPKKGGF